MSKGVTKLIVLANKIKNKNEAEVSLSYTTLYVVCRNKEKIERSTEIGKCLPVSESSETK